MTDEGTLGRVGEVFRLIAYADRTAAETRKRILNHLHELPVSDIIVEDVEGWSTVGIRVRRRTRGFCKLCEWFRESGLGDSIHVPPLEPKYQGGTVSAVCLNGEITGMHAREYEQEYSRSGVLVRES